MSSGWTGHHRGRRRLLVTRWGLRSDGTVVAVGYNYYGQCNVGGWADIAQVAAGGYHTVGLKSDGTVVAVGYNTTASAMSATGQTSSRSPQADYHTVGLRSDGTVVAAGDNT